MKKIKKFIAIVAIALTSVTAAIAREPHKGYRGMVSVISDIKPDISFYGNGPTDSRFNIGVSTSHGYQFNRWIFAGGGLAIQDFVKENTIYAAAVFGQVRTDLYLGRFKPHIDVKLGYNMANYGGIYFCPTIGYRIDTKSPVGINIAIGATINGNRTYQEQYSPAEGWLLTRRLHQTDTTLHLSVGIDFQL